MPHHTFPYLKHLISTPREFFFPVKAVGGRGRLDCIEYDAEVLMVMIGGKSFTKYQ